MGYNYLYVMTRVLNEKKPLNVLDLGVGVPSISISQYFKCNNIYNDIHDVVEQDEEWIKFYNNTKRISEVTCIHNVQQVEKDHNGFKYYAYDDISHIVDNKKYNVILIDGSWGVKAFQKRHY